uniref:Integrin, alpha 5 (fibronectin receptor, alpha polypeptide) n=1 Tax=Sphaeramia orbicularis TaxID=375764 RepID=A0A673CI09_9TELE
MGLERFCAKTPGMVTLALHARSLLCIIGLLSSVSQPVCEAFNLDVENPAVYSGPHGSYFGYAVDFYLAESASVVIGAPKANTRQVDVTEGGSVFYCPWSLSQSDCHSIEFDAEGDRNALLNDTKHQVDFKSHQWFGATVRSHGDTILACAPLYSWRTEKDIPRSDATGTCYLSVHNFTKFVEYAPCRTEISDAVGQGYCQGGFSADFTTDGKVVLGGPGSYFWQGQVISAAKENIIKAYYPGYFMQSVDGQMQTKQVKAEHDDSYQGYSVAVGEFSGDQVEDFVAGVPKGLMLYGSVRKLNHHSHFGFHCDALRFRALGFKLGTDIGKMVDLLVGAPMFMMRGSGGRLEEMGRVYVYLQQGPLNLELSEPHLTGTQVFGRFGSTIAPLGDLNQDGFNDVAISAPFGGDDHQGLVYIFNGYSGGLREKPSQVIAGQWAAGTIPASFGFSLRGAQDLDMNGYPDLIVGAFGVDKAILYRYVILTFNTSASLTVSPGMINPEEKNCMIVNGNTNFQVEVLLDSRDHKKKGAVKRALFLDSQQPSLHKSVRVRHGERVCDHKKIYLRDEKDFKDKLSPIYVAFNYSLDPKAAADSHGLRPILNYQTTNVIEQKAQILLDCGEDNICVPDLKLAVVGDRKEVYLGDDNSLTLTFNARNEGEGGAYEAELYVVLPPEADYIGIARNNELTCSYDTENQTRYLSCELGNPMKSGTSLMEGLRFTVPRVKDTHKTIQFDLQIRSKNENNSHSEIVSYKLEVVVQAEVILQGVSRPDKVFFPPANWQVTKNYGTEQDIGPGVEHIYELVNNGPSRISHTLLTLHCPLNVQSNHLLYPVEFSTVGPINCTSDHKINSLSLKVSHTCTTAHLSGSNKAKSDSEDLPLILSQIAYKQYVLECLARYSVEKMPYAILPKHYPSGHKKVFVLTPVVWNKPDIENSVPLWIIILAVLVGLLLLALLIYILYKFGFFKRSVPYGTAMEKAQLKPQAASEA